eukprot:1147041-Pelagomonas_calceolata.AAC.7
MMRCCCHCHACVLDLKWGGWLSSTINSSALVFLLAPQRAPPCNQPQQTTLDWGFRGAESAETVFWACSDAHSFRKYIQRLESIIQISGKYIHAFHATWHAMSVKAGSYYELCHALNMKAS